MPKIVGRYELTEVLGTGAFATVWRAYDPVMEQDVAIKVLADNWARDAEMRDRFIAEAKLALGATSRSLIRVHYVATDTEDNTPYIVMNLVEGGTLETRLRQNRLTPPTPQQALALTRDIAVAVGELHDNGLIHRDLKPGNILFHTERGEERPILGDFGLARALDRSALTMVSGTPAYSAPEQAAGLLQLTEQADIYPLGVMFLEMLTGTIPTRDNMVDAAIKPLDVGTFLAENQTELPEQYIVFVESLVDPNPENRPATAHDVVRQIDELLGDQPNQPAPRPPAPRPQRAIATGISPPPEPPEPAVQLREGSGQPALLIPAAIGLLLAVLAIGTFVVTRGGDTTAIENNNTDVTTTTVQASTDNDTATTTTQTVDTTTTAPAATTTIESIEATPGAEIPEDFPVPIGALLERALSNGNLARTYTLAGTIGTVDDFYTTGEWTVTSRTDSAEAITLTLTQGESTVNVSIEDFNNSTGVDLARLIVTPIQ